MNNCAIQPLVFLDIDGVLNSIGWKMARHYYHIEEHSHSRELNDQYRYSEYPISSAHGVSEVMDYGHLLSELDLTAIAIFETLIQDTQARVIISSSWRLLHRGIEWLQTLLYQRGSRILPDAIIGKTPVVRKRENFNQRGNEVEAYLESNPEWRHNYICVDDCSYHYHPYQRVVETNPAIGFSLLDYQTALNFLCNTAKAS
ncbi:HAD domain-containing protein [Aliikangiella sp. G2MR2-5]|uniref:HAD domain-containing protein n=1 Tax=Aliikangiella sp. G2MR2-5 TaxID=2788943 RepID=UPI0018AC0DCE|nr:HAD domain-containing protein [Aliikangiella sp. G2MR2-5]